MAETPGTFAQVDMPATTATTVYTVVTPGVFRVNVANRTAAPISIRLGVAIGGAADDVKQWEWYDLAIPANDSVSKTLVCAAGDLIRGYASAVSTSWVVKGFKLS